jgi:hypothetical protein
MKLVQQTLSIYHTDFSYSFISVRQTQLLLCYNYLKDRVSVSYDYMFRSFFNHPQVYKSYNLYILAV